MERHEVLAMMTTLKLAGMRTAYDDILADGLKRRHPVQQIIGALLKAEIADKTARSIKYQMASAKLPAAKELAGVCPIICVSGAMGVALSGLSALKPESDLRTGSQTASSQRSTQRVVASGRRRYGSPGTAASSPPRRWRSCLGSCCSPH